MLEPVKFKVDGPEFRRLLLKNFPELYEEIEDDEGLVHLEMGALEGLANSCIKSGDMDNLKRVYEFVSELCRNEKELHPDIINAINVSFLEGLSFENEKFGEGGKKLLPPNLLEKWEAQLEHNRKIGWLK